jgi:hypothetical protein
MALNGLHMLLSYEVVPPAEVKNILRVLTIQTSTGKSEHLMKVLQVLLLIVNLLSADETNFQYLTDSTLHSLFSLCLLIGDGRGSVSLASTALATASQVILMVLVEIERIQPSGQDIQSSPKYTSLVNSANNLLSDIVNFAFLKPGEWNKHSTMPQSNSLDILYDFLLSKKHFFVNGGIFSHLWKDKIIPYLMDTLRSVRDEYLLSAQKFGIASASSTTYRIVRLTRFVLIDLTDVDIFDSCTTTITLLLHTLQPDIGSLIRVSSRDSPGRMSEDSSQSSIEKATSIFSVTGPQSLLTKFGANSSNQKTMGSSKTFSPPPSFYLTLLCPSNDNRQHHIVRQHSAFQIPAHPAGCTLETLLSFLLNDVTTLVSTDAGLTYFSNAITSITTTVSTFLANALNNDSNCKDLDQAIRESQITTLLEGVLSGAEDDVGFVIRSVQELLLSSPSIETSDLMVLAFEVLQVCARVLTKLCLTQASHDLQENEILFSIPPNILNSLATDKLASDNIHRYLREICESTFESVHESCLMVLLKVNCSAAVRRSLGMLNELSLCCGFTGCVRACNLIISSLCKLCVPKWHGIELDAVETAMASKDEQIRWRHLQAFVRLLQIVHLLADVISDWDTIMDSFTQLFSAIQAKQYHTEELSPSDVTKIEASFDRFKMYSIFVSDDALFRLMSSLVAISLNELGDTDNNASIIHNKSSEMPAYMKEAQSHGVLSFSFRAIIDIAKLNAFRVSSIWQMVTSHLRMIASQKVCYNFVLTREFLTMSVNVL